MIKYLILLLLLFILIFNYKYYENFSLSIHNKRVPPTFNDNHDKIWLRSNRSSNSNTIQDIPNKGHLNDSRFNMVRNVLFSDEIDNLFLKYIKNNNIKNGRILYYVENSDSMDDMTKIINKLNKKSWVNKKMNLDKNIRLNYKFKVCSIKAVNNILNKVYSMVNYKFVIYKYKINNVTKFSNGIYSYGLIIVLLQEFGYFGYTIYISGHMKDNNIILDGYDLIGHYYTSDFFLNHGIENQNFNNYIHINKEQKIKTPDKFKKKKRNIFSDYKCFSVNNDNSNNQSDFLLYFNRETCESDVNLLGNSKEIGIWDKPCEKNSDCFFYNQNLNYDNNFGGCNNGYCQLPIDVNRVGYRYFNKDKKPYCYNCDSKIWKATTNLGVCCDDQKDKKKYPFLKSPDYAFRGDRQDRLNYYRQNNYK
jgi:hypothetical protein